MAEESTEPRVVVIIRDERPSSRIVACESGASLWIILVLAPESSKKDLTIFSNSFLPFSCPIDIFLLC